MKNDLNSVLIEGNLISDPELVYEANGRPVAKMRIASVRCYKKEDECVREVSVFDITAYCKQAEACAEYLSKGRGVRVVGRLKQPLPSSLCQRIGVEAEHVEFKPVQKPVPKTA